MSMPSQRTAFVASLAVVALVAPALADAQYYGYAMRNVNVRAGPDRAYPLVGWLQDGTEVEIFGCLDSWRWCDIQGGVYRGWVYAGFIAYPYQDGWAAIRDIGPDSGLPVISFTLNFYWDTYYMNWPWYAQWPWWASRPPVYVPPWRPPLRPPIVHPRPPIGVRPPRPPVVVPPRPPVVQPPIAKPPAGKPPVTRPTPPTAVPPDARPPSVVPSPTRPPTGGHRPAPPPSARPPSSIPPGVPPPSLRPEGPTPMPMAPPAAPRPHSRPAPG